MPGPCVRLARARTELYKGDTICRVIETMLYMALHVTLKPGEFSLADKQEHEHKHKRMCKQVKTGSA